MAAMTPWVYTDDYSKQFNVARAMLGESDRDTARLSDQAIQSALDTFGYQSGMAVLAQRLIVEIGQEVTASREEGGSSFQWSVQRLDGLKELKAKADQGKLPDPLTGSTIELLPGSIYLTNQPAW